MKPASGLPLETPFMEYERRFNLAECGALPAGFC